MTQRAFLFLAASLLLPVSSWAQDARGMAIGNAATAAPMGIFGLYWNPALEALPDGGTWGIASGFSAFDTSNAGSPILRFDQSSASQSSTDPIQRSYQYSGIFGVRYSSFSFGVLYDQTLNYSTTQRSLDFLNDRSSGSVGASAYTLDDHRTQQQIETLIVSYAIPLPIGNFPFLSAGGSLKYHYGTQFDQTSLTGTFTQGSATGYQYTRVTSTSGLGLSMDLGFFAKISDALNMGFMMQNLKSDFNWQGQQRVYTLDPSTGADVAPASAASVTVAQPFPYTAKLGMSIAPPEKNIYVDTEVSWVNQTTHWRGGIERCYSESGLVVRLGAFADPISAEQLWTFGFGFLRPNFNVDIACVTRSIPDLENSIALGGAIDATVRF